MQHILPAFVFCLLYGFSLFADDISIGEPTYGGSGCPRGSADVILGPGGNSLDILFRQYIVSSIDQPRKSCNLAIPLHVPQGLSVALFKVNYRGFNSLPPGSFSRFRVEYFFAGSQGPTYTRAFYGPLYHDFLLTDTLPISSVVWSPCGKDVILRSNSSLMVTASGPNNDALAGIDREDIKGGLIYHLQWKFCS